MIGVVILATSMIELITVFLTALAPAVAGWLRARYANDAVESRKDLRAEARTAAILQGKGSALPLLERELADLLQARRKADAPPRPPIPPPTPPPPLRTPGRQSPPSPLLPPPPMPRAITGIGILLILILPAFLLTTGCAPRILVIPSDRQIGFLPSGGSITATNDLYLVPPARMKEILDALRSP